jgi:hypothetical protein
MSNREKLPPLPRRFPAVFPGGRPVCIKELSAEGKETMAGMPRAYLDGIHDGIFELLRFFPFGDFEKILEWADDSPAPYEEREARRALVVANVALVRYGPEEFISHHKK